MTGIQQEVEAEGKAEARTTLEGLTVMLMCKPGSVTTHSQTTRPLSKPLCSSGVPTNTPLTYHNLLCSPTALTPANSDASPANPDSPCHDPSPETPHIAHQPPNPKKTPNAPPNFCPCPAPISANSDASPANSDGPLANFGACPAATDTYPGPPEPREPPPLFPIFATHHQLNTLVPLTYSGVSRQPWGNPHSPMIPSTYQCGTILDHNRHPPTPLSPAKPRRHSRRTPKSSGSHLPVSSQSPGLISVSRSHLSLLVLSQSPGLVSSPFRYRSCYHFVSLFESTLVPYQPRPILSDTVLVTPSDNCAQVFINLNDLTNSAITITNPDTPLPGPNLALRSPPTPSIPRISRMAFCLNPAKTASFPHNPTSPDLPGSVWITSPQLSAQAISARNVFECSVTSARGSRPPSKDSPSAAEPPRSAEPDSPLANPDTFPAGPNTFPSLLGPWNLPDTVPDPGLHH
ncbi:GTP-binding protein TypA/BipA like protein [Termitomyces sp. T112]|nr:GTP-binding protein TypA/BipA like protein [Termitomyces sp. T112]